MTTTDLTTVPVPTVAADDKGATIEAFTFGGAESVLDRRDVLNHIECWHNGRYYEPPINPRNLSRIWNASPHHRSAIGLRKNLLVKHFIPHRLLDRVSFEQFALDFIVQANGYLERQDSMTGRPLTLKRSLAQQTRRGLKDGEFFFVDDRNQIHAFAPGSVFQLMEHDISQEIYGVPEYLGALQSMFLNEAATLFRRRYYINGAHAGFIMYLKEAGISEEDAEAVKAAVLKPKGVGNFKNLFLHIPNGHEKGIQILPIADVSAKDEFLGIKNTSRDDILAAWRTPPQLLGVVPANAGGFGDIEKAEAVFFRNEIEPLMMRMMAVNDWIGEEVIRFKPYEPIIAAPKAGAAT